MGGSILCVFRARSSSQQPVFGLSFVGGISSVFLQAIRLDGASDFGCRVYTPSTLTRKKNPPCSMSPPHRNIGCLDASHGDESSSALAKLLRPRYSLGLGG